MKVAHVLEKRLLYNEFGAIYLLHYFYKSLNYLFGFDGKTALVLYSCLSGGLFVLFALFIADELGRTFYQKSSIFLFVVSFGTIQQFCGYIEVYALVSVISAIYIYFSILYINDKVNIILPVLVIFGGSLCHLASMMFIPSLIFLFYAKVLWKAPLFRKKQTILLTIFFFLVAIYLLLKRYASPLVLPILKTPDVNFTLFSFTHFWEFFNSQVLASGMGLFLIITLVFIAIRKKAKINLLLWFLGMASLFPLCAIFTFDAILGSADWDILSFPCIVYNVMAIYLLFYLFGEKEQIGNLKYAVTILITFMFLHTLPWLLINASDKSIERIQEIVETDPGTYYIGHPPSMVLAELFRLNGLENESLRMFKEAYENYPRDIRAQYNYASALLRKHDLDTALPILENLYDNYPFYSPPIGALAAVYESQKETDKLIAVLRRLFELYKHQREFVTDYYSRDKLVQLFSLFEDSLLRQYGSDSDELQLLRSELSKLN